MYALLGFFCAVLLLVTFMWKVQRRAVLLVGFAYLFGLALTNNVILLALLPAFLYALLTSRLCPTIQPSENGTIEPCAYRTIHPSIYPSIVLTFLLGLSLYLYLPIRSRFDPFVDWGNPESLRNLVAVLSAREFAPQFFSLFLTAHGGPLRGLVDYLMSLPREFGYLGFALGVVGFFALLRRERKLLGFLVAGIVLSVGFAVFAGGGPDLPAYFLPSYIFFSLLIGTGTFELFLRIRMKAICVLVPLSVIVLSVCVHLEQSNQRGEWGALTYSKDLGRTMAPDGILLSENTVDCFLLWHLQAVEGAFPRELAIYTPLLLEEWYRDKLTLEGLRLPEAQSLSEVALSISSSRPVYYTPGEQWLIDPEQLCPSGLVFRLGGPTDMENHLSLLERYDFGGWGGGKTRRHYMLIHSRLGEYFYRRGRILEAMSEYRRAAQIEPENPGVFYNLGILYEAQGDVERAIGSYRRAIDLGSRVPSASLNLGILHMEAGSLIEAVQWFKKSLRTGETSRARYSLGMCYLRMGDVESAMHEIGRAIVLDPESPDAYNNLGICYYQLGQYEEAAQQFRRALELNPDYSQAKHNLEMVMKRMGGS